MGKYGFRPASSQGCLCSWILSLTDFQETVMGTRSLLGTCYTNAGNGGAGCVEGRKKPVGVVCVDIVMMVGG